MECISIPRVVGSYANLELVGLYNEAQGFVNGPETGSEEWFSDDRPTFAALI